MKKKFLSILVLTLLIGLVGCSSPSEEAATQEETIVEQESSEVEETTTDEASEETEAVIGEETEDIVEEAETVEEEIPDEELTFEREDHVITACVTNLSIDSDFGVLVSESKNTYSTNDYMNVEIMTELYNRGYDIEGFTVTWMVALNEDGSAKWTFDNGEESEISYGKVDDSEERYIKLYPLFIKDENIDKSKIVGNYYNAGDCWNLNPNVDSNSGYWEAIHKAIYDMKNDENYEEIDFKIPDTNFKTYIEAKAQKRQANDENVLIKDFTLNDWYNGMIYAMFESKTVDLDGFFDCRLN